MSVLRQYTASRWQTKNYWDYLHSTSQQNVHLPQTSPLTQQGQVGINKFHARINSHRHQYRLLCPIRGRQRNGCKRHSTAHTKHQSKAGEKLAIFCHSRLDHFEFLGRTIPPDEVVPQGHKVTNYQTKIRFPKSKKQVEKYIGFVNYFRSYIARLSEFLIGMYQLLKNDAKTRSQ